MQQRQYKVLAIETSCDDTCVALLDRTEGDVKLVQHIKSTLDSVEQGGIVPTRAFDHHQRSIARITRELIDHNGLQQQPPDLLCVTRGPGMKGSLSIGLDFAKGLAAAWRRPLVGVHHMLGHLLTPRFETNGQTPSFPFLTLLISGGHTMLVLSNSLLDHEVLCESIDVACGDALDKCARELGLKGNNLGRELELFVQDNEAQWRTQEWHVPTPLYNKRGRVDLTAFAFGAFQGYVRKVMDQPGFNDTMIPSLGYQIQRGIFQHVVDKVELTMEKNYDKIKGCTHFVASGGVASNSWLRRTLDETFHKRGMTTSYPQVELCTDNAVMIGWAGIELYEHGLTTNLDVSPISRWPMAEITKVDGWVKE